MDDAERVTLIEETVAPVVDDHGLELVDLDWRALRPRGLLRLYVAKPGARRRARCGRGDRRRVRRRSLVPGPRSPAEEGPGVPLGDRQAGPLLAGRRGGVSRAADR